MASRRRITHRARIASALLAGVPLGLLSGAAVANPKSGGNIIALPRGVSDDPARAEAVRVSIPQGPLEAALVALSDQARLKLVYPSALTAGHTTSGVEGEFRPLDALTKLLDGTDLTYRSAGSSTITLVNPRYVQLDGASSGTAVTLEELSVEGQGPGRGVGQPPPTGTVGQPSVPYAGGQVASGGRVGFLGNRSVFDTPFTQNNYTSQLIRDQGALVVSDVYANDAAIRQTQSPFSISSSNVFLRGLPLNSRDIAFDGLYGLVSTYRPTLEGTERVEILNGPSALLYGFSPSGSAAGVVNLTPKRALATPITRFTAQYINDASGGGAFDIGRRFGDADSIGVRVNGAYRNGALPIDRTTEEVGVFTAGLDYRGEKFRASLDLSYQHNTLQAPVNAFTVAPGIIIPRVPDLTKSVQQPWEKFNQDQGFGLLRLEYDLLPNMTVFGAIGGSYVDYQYNGTFSRILNNAGSLTTTTRPFFAPKDIISAETGVRVQFDTGFVRHEAAVVGTHFDSSERSEYLSGPSFASNLYAPVIVPRPVLTRDFPGRENFMQQLDGIGVNDTMSVLDGRVQLIAGGRFQRAQTRDVDPSAPAITSYDKSAATPVAALLIKPITPLTVYASYAEGFGFGPTAPANATNRNAVFPPVVTSQIETGIKFDLGRVGLTAAFYELTQPFGFLNPATNIFGVNGEQRNRGVDFNIFGEPVDGFRVLGGLTLLDGVLLRTAGGTFDGKIAPGVPDVQLNLGGEIDLPRSLVEGLTLTGRIIYTTRQFYDQANTQSIPDYARLDLGLRYRFNVNQTPLVARLNVYNVTGKNYYQSTGQGQLSLGQPRTFLFSLQAEL